MNDPNVLTDYYARRHTQQYRSTFLLLAEQFIANKDYKKAGLVMSAIGMSKNMINKYIKEAKEVN